MAVAAAVKVACADVTATAAPQQREGLPAKLSEEHRKVRDDHGSEARRTAEGGWRFSAKTTVGRLSTATQKEDWCEIGDDRRNGLRKRLSQMSDWMGRGAGQALSSFCVALSTVTSSVSHLFSSVSRFIACGGVCVSLEQSSICPAPRKAIRWRSSMRLLWRIH
jgi:hypothetical protein